MSVFHEQLSAQRILDEAGDIQKGGRANWYKCQGNKF